MSRSRSHLPFYVGQTADEVLLIAKQTGRDRIAIEFTDLGRSITVRVESPTYKERRTERERIRAALEEHQIKVGDDMRVRYLFSDCALTFERPKSNGKPEPYCITTIDTWDNNLPKRDIT